MEPHDHVHKPPLGLMPEWVWKEQRLEEITAAIMRYLIEGVFVPREWYNEQQRLGDWLRLDSKNKQRTGIVDNPPVIYKSQTQLRMKSFDLQKALAGESVVTRRGIPVKIHLHLPETGSQCVVGVIEKQLKLWYEDGRSSAMGEGSKDLFMAPVKKKGYAAIFPNPEPLDTGVKNALATFANIGIYATEEEARRYALDSAIVIPVEWEE